MKNKLIKIPPELCIKCRGSKMLCGLAYCPVNITDKIKKVYSFSGNNINGLMRTLYYLDTYQVEYIEIDKYKLEYNGVI